MTTNSSTPTFCDYFCDPYDIRTSFQLSDRLRNGEALNSIDRIRDADAALQKASYRAFLRLIRPVISFLNPGQRGQVISRIIYNDMYLQSFKPVFLALPSSNAEGRFNIGSERSVHRELGINMEAIRKTLACASRDYFHGLYGKDISRTSFSVRYSRSIGEQNRPPGSVGEAQEESDPAFKDTNSNFLHMDEKKGITTIVYLSEVAAANGGFRYVEGSHEARISPVLKAFHEFIYNDLNIATYEDVMQFPPEFRAGINYYFWLEGEKRKVIDSFTRTLTGPAGTGISFAGNRLLHGGGIPYSGERSALFISHVGIFYHRMRQMLHPLWILQRAGYAA